MEEKGYSAVTVGTFGHAALKKFDYQLTAGHCAPASGYECDIYIYTPAGGGSGGGGGQFVAEKAPNTSGRSQRDLDADLNGTARNTNDTGKLRRLVAQGANLSSTNGEPWRHTPLGRETPNRAGTEKTVTCRE